MLSLFGFYPQRVVSKEIEIAEEPVILVQPLPDIKVYAKQQVVDRWGEAEWDSFDKLIKRESSWNSNAQNPNSSAYGLGQFLNSTWASVGCVKTSNKYEQIDCAIDYVQKRYNTPTKALSWHVKNNWY